MIPVGMFFIENRAWTSELSVWGREAVRRATIVRLVAKTTKILMQKDEENICLGEKK